MDHFLMPLPQAWSIKRLKTPFCFISSSLKNHTTYSTCLYNNKMRNKRIFLLGTVYKMNLVPAKLNTNKRNRGQPWYKPMYSSHCSSEWQAGKVLKIDIFSHVLWGGKEVHIRLYVTEVQVLSFIWGVSLLQAGPKASFLSWENFKCTMNVKTV